MRAVGCARQQTQQPPRLLPRRVAQTRSIFGKDCYVQHEDDLPEEGTVALVSNRRVLLLEKPPGADPLTVRCSIRWNCEFEDILSAEAAGGSDPVASQAGPVSGDPPATKSAGEPSWLPSEVVLNLRLVAKDRLKEKLMSVAGMNSGATSRRIVCKPGTQQARRRPPVATQQAEPPVL